MIYIKDLSLSFGVQKIYDHISCSIGAYDKIGLVGRNGTGKSTLLQLIAQAQEEDNPSISIEKNKTIAYFPQEVVLLSEKSIFEETLSAFAHLVALLEESKQLEVVLETTQVPEAIERYASIHNELTEINPNRVKAEVHELLIGLGFLPTQLDQPVAQLSVGWKMRIVLAKLLLQKADFYLLDEPTNHLDIVAKEWFLQFLKNASFGFILVCHERYFLNALCSKVLELELGKAKLYTGNYTRYEQQKEHDLLLLESAYLQQQKEIQAKQTTIERFRASANKAKMAQSMIKALEKVERILLPPSTKNVVINFPPIQPSGKVVLKVANVAYAFDQKQLFKNVNFELERGDKVALIAPNGAGKTTLFNLIAGIYPKQQGSIDFGYNVTKAVFDQDQTATLPLEKTIIDALEDFCSKIPQGQMRSILGAFLFSNDDVYKKIKVLSGGEKNRVGMIKVLLQDANFLLLDEPTNHLDMQSKEVLLRALKHYKGTIFFVSHDQDFINQLATKIIELTFQGTRLYHGDYDLYLYQKNGAKAITQEPAKNVKEAAPVKNVVTPDIQKKQSGVERQIRHLEQSIKKLEERFAELQYGTLEFNQAQAKLKKNTLEYEDLMKQWEALQA